MKFQVVEYGDYFGTVLVKYYGVKRLTSKPKKFGGFKAGKCSNFLRDFFSLFINQKISRNDRIPMSCFKGVTFRGRIKTVDKGFNQKAIPIQLQYSVIDELLEVKVL